MPGAYYNENDPHAAAVLRNLIAAGLIPDGDVDERSIIDVRPADLVGYTQCHFFAGIGGWPATLRRIGWPDDRPAWTASVPCQGFSRAGKKLGFDDPRHLWPVVANLIRECRPPVFIGEQSPDSADWIRLVHGDLEAMDYAVGSMPIEAASAGSDHRRDRFYFVADDNSDQRRREQRERGSQVQGPWDESRWGREGGVVAFPESVRGDGPLLLCEREEISRIVGPGGGSGYDWFVCDDGKARRAGAGIRLLADGISGAVARRDADGRTAWYSRVAALKGFGNAVDLRPASQFVAACMRIIIPMAGYPIVKSLMKVAEVLAGNSGGAGGWG